MLLAHCPACGFVFQSAFTGFVFGGPTLMMGNAESCPQCGSLANTFDGTYQVQNGEVQAIHASPWSQAIIERLRGLFIEAIHSPEPNREEITQKVKEAAPELAGVLDVLLKAGLPRSLWLTLLGGILLLMARCESEVKIEVNLNTLIHQISGQSHSQQAEQLEQEQSKERPGSASQSADHGPQVNPCAE